MRQFGRFNDESYKPIKNNLLKVEALSFLMRPVNFRPLPGDRAGLPFKKTFDV
jgi:hypothetical protein